MSLKWKQGPAVNYIQGKEIEEKKRKSDDSLTMSKGRVLRRPNSCWVITLGQEAQLKRFNSREEEPGGFASKGISFGPPRRHG